MGDEMVRRHSVYKVKAYQLFKSGVPLREIAEKLGCAKSLIYRWANREQWTSPLQSPLASIESAAQSIQDGDESGITEALRSKLPERLAELEEACKKGNVSAIALWIKLTGLTPSKPEAAEPKQIPTFHMDVNLRRDPKVIEGESVGQPIAMLDEPITPVVEFENVPGGSPDSAGLTYISPAGAVPESHSWADASQLSTVVTPARLENSGA